MMIVKRITLSSVIASLLVVVIGGVVLHAPLTVFVGAHIPEIATPIKAWKELVILIASVLILFEIWRQKQWRRLVHPVVALSIAYIVLHLVMAVWWRLPIASMIAGLMVDLRFVAIFVVVYLFLSLYPAYKKWLLWAFGIGGIIVIGFACLQIVLPRDILASIGYGPETIQPYLTVDSNDAYVRINSTLRGPNPLGVYAMVSLVIGAAYTATNWRQLQGTRRLLLLIAGGCSALALWASYSRSAALALLVAFGVIVVATKKWRLAIEQWIMIAGIVLAGVVSGLFLLQDTSFMHNVILHDDPTSGPTVTSNSAHADSLKEGLQRMIAQPFGAGVGSTGSASLRGDAPIIIENQYLFIAHEAGWLGVLLYLVLFSVVLELLWRRRRSYLALGVFAAGIGIAFIGLMQPVFVDDTISILWWAFAALVIATVPQKRKGRI